MALDLPGLVRKVYSRFLLGSMLPTGTLKAAAVSLPSMRACWVQSVLQWYDYLATILFPSAGIEDIPYRSFNKIHIEALRKFTQEAFKDSNQAISLLNSEISMMRKAVLQNAWPSIFQQLPKGDLVL